MPDEGNYGIGSDQWPGLAKLVEEMAELTVELMKLVAMGGNSTISHWDGRGRLYERITNESADVTAALDFFIKINNLPVAVIEERAGIKFDKFEYWHAEQSRENL